MPFNCMCIEAKSCALIKTTYVQTT